MTCKDRPHDRRSLTGLMTDLQPFPCLTPWPTSWPSPRLTKIVMSGQFLILTMFLFRSHNESNVSRTCWVPTLPPCFHSSFLENRHGRDIMMMILSFFGVSFCILFVIYLLCVICICPLLCNRCISDFDVVFCVCIWVCFLLVLCVQLPLVFLCDMWWERREKPRSPLKLMERKEAGFWESVRWVIIRIFCQIFLKIFKICLKF